MASKVDVILIDCVTEFWPIAEPFLVTGLKAARTSTLGCLLVKLFSGQEHLWLITSDGKPCGAFITEIRQDYKTGESFVGVSNLGGVGVDAWARYLADTMIQFAKDNECDAVKFYGRRAWGRVLPDFKIKGKHDAVNMLFERAVQ